MKQILLVLSLMAQGCLYGCQLTPLPASKIFGVSNPTLKVKVPGKGSVEIPTNFKGHFQIDQNPETKLLHVDVQIDSSVSEVVEAEGARIPAMDTYRQMENQLLMQNAQLAAQTTQAISQTLGSLLAPIAAGYGQRIGMPQPESGVINGEARMRQSEVRMQKAEELINSLLARTPP